MNTHDPIVGRYVYVQCEGKTYRTYYEENGEGIPLVCLHTAGADAREYRHQLCDPDITQNFRVIAFDMPWHGKSNPPADFHLMEEEYKLTTRFYCEFIIAFCRALELKKPVVMGQSMGGNVCLWLALKHENEFSALIALEGCDHSPGWWIDPLHHPEIHGGDAISTCMLGLMSPESPEDYRHETAWFYAQGGPGVFKGDLFFYSVDSDIRDQVHKISGKIPIYFLTGDYDFACTPEMTERTAEKVKNSETIIFSGGHFPTSEDPDKFKTVVTPVLRKIVNGDPERRGRGAGSGAGSASNGISGSVSSASLGASRTGGRNDRADGRRVIELG